MDYVQQCELITRELERVRQEFVAAVPKCPDDVAALATCIHDNCFATDFDINAALEQCCINSSSVYSKFRRFFGRPPENTCSGAA